MKENTSPEINSDSFKIETIKFNNNEVSVCPERGGIITSLKLNNNEILYLDESTFKDTSVSVKGGIPILFPQAGPITIESQFSDLKQHGFARNSNEWIFTKTENGFIETLKSNPETLKKYPYKFEFSIIGKFEEDNSFTLTQKVKNEGDKEMPISIGIHPYFKVPSNEKENIDFNFPGGEIIKNETEKWSNDGTTSINNPKIADQSANLEVNIPSLGTLIIVPCVEYQKIWVWSMSDKNFICIEPVMRDVNGLIENPEKIQPQNTFSASVNFKLK
ncbi:MAG: hypothetical protein PHP97_02615 [Candidatus Shapirobacteria bacterium]|nr:hypothetical protein [Candidatus Shapirobacteria bacterium]MDD3002274.1 hypothetical protein [Candidatus Shapirobacteria bacterium]MDD4382721.1 hypothetical protein [Candidatus Shapirobacteria bacterium]